LIGGIESLNQSLEETPLAPLTGVTEPLADGLGTVSDGLADASEQDPTPVSNLLAETIGQEQEGYINDQTGVAGVVSNLSLGLTEGAEDTPLDPLTTAVSDMLLAPLSSGISDAGDAFIENAEMAGPGEELVTTTGTLLGGETQPATEEPPTEEPPADGGTTGTPLDAVVDPVVSLTEGGDTPDTPLDPVTDALMENSDPAVLGESLGGVVEDIGANTPLEAVTEPLADTLAGGGDSSSSETTPVDDLLTATEGTPISTVTDPLLEATSPITGGLI
jgi:hypothetical protein